MGPLIMARREDPELTLQKVVMRYLALALPKDAFMTAFPAEGGAGGFRRGQRMKASGLVPGCPDIWIVWSGRLFCIELKSDTGRVSDKQEACIAALSRAGVDTYICRSLDQVQLSLEHSKIPLRARAA